MVKIRLNTEARMKFRDGHRQNILEDILIYQYKDGLQTNAKQLICTVVFLLMLSRP